MNGFDALLHLRRLFPDARVIALTALSQISQDALEVAELLGADRAVPKTRNPYHLLDTVQEVLAA
jgi:DNA-binding NarL/FixJ family response regulator